MKLGINRNYQNERGQKIFHIKLRSNTQKVNLQDPHFLRILQQQYATKYLQSIGIEPTTKNILSILKKFPLKDCQIQESRLNSGIYTDTITIIAQKRQIIEDKKLADIEISNDMMKHANLKKIRTNIFKEDKQKKNINAQAEQNQNQKQSQDQNKENNKFNFDLNEMKSKYIFPFNQNFTRKKNYLLKESVNQNQPKNQLDKHLIFQSKIFNFPFTMVKVPVNSLKQLQTPITVSLYDLVQVLHTFTSQFPKQIIPIRKIEKKDNDNQKLLLGINPEKNITDKAQGNRNFLPEIRDRKQNLSNKKILQRLNQELKSAFTQQQRIKLFDLLKSEQMARFIGIFLHFSYWLVFGNVNPVQIEPKVRKQLYLILFQSFEYFNLKAKNKRIWITFYMPMILLTLKMVTQYSYKKMYPTFFQENIFVKNSIGNIAFDKIMYLIDNLFDRSYLNGRFIFFESNFNDKQQNSSNDKKSIRKRIFGTSPMIDMIIPDPKDGRARSILAKKNEIQYREGILQFSNNEKIRKQIKDELLKQINKQDNTLSEEQCRQKMLNVVLLKLQNKIEQKTGHNSIIKLPIY